MKKILSLLLAALLLFSFAACGKEKSERKRAEKGQNTTTLQGGGGEEVILDTGLLEPLDKTYAKSNVANVVYDPNVLIKLAESNNVVDIACVGDGLTYGTGATDPEKDSYPAQLGALLGSKFKVTNYGHAGAFVADFGRSNASSLRYFNTKEYDKLRKDKPEVVVLMLGTEDISYLDNAEDYEEIKAAYIDLIKKFKSIKSNPMIFVCTPIVRVATYDTYIAMEALRNAAIAAANDQKTYVIDTYSITKQYFHAALYETDGINTNNDGYKYLAETVNNALTKGYTEYSEASSGATNYLVYLDPQNGTLDSVGATADKPTSNLARAIDLCRNGGTIVLMGHITPSRTGWNSTRSFIAPEHSGKIVLTSVDPKTGTDYRKTNDAQLFVEGSMYLGGDMEFRDITFNYLAASTKLVCNYNNVTFGDGFECELTGDGSNAVLIFGHEVVSYWQSEAELSCTENATLTVKNGQFTYLRGGNWRTASTKPSVYGYGTVKSGVTVNINIEGGRFISTEKISANVTSASDRVTTALGQNGIERGAVVNMNISGGEFKGAIAAVPRMNPYKDSKAPTIAGDINITVNDGLFTGSGFVYLQTYNGDIKPSVSGSYSLTINGGTHAGNKKLVTAKHSANATLTIDASCAYIAKWVPIGTDEPFN